MNLNSLVRFVDKTEEKKRSVSPGFQGCRERKSRYSPKDYLLVGLETSSKLSPERSELSRGRGFGIARVADDGSSSSARKGLEVGISRNEHSPR